MQTAKPGCFEKLYAKTRLHGKLPLIILTLTMAINLFATTYHIDRFAAVDEPLWTFGRIPRFWKNLTELDLDKTGVSDKPGLTVALISGPGFYALDKEERDTLLSETPQIPTAKLNLFLRLPLALFASFSLALFYLLLKRLLDPLSAAVSTMFIGLSPILIGASRIINPDGLLWIFAPLALFSFLVYQTKASRKALYFAGIMLGLALLTKYVANILYIVFLALILLKILASPTRLRSGDELKNTILHALGDFGRLIMASMLTILLIYPVAWVEPSKLLETTIFSQAFRSTWHYFALLILALLADAVLLKGKVLAALSEPLRHRRVLPIAIAAVFIASIVFALANTYADMRIYDFEQILASPKTSFKSAGLFGLFTSNFYPLVFGIAPVALFLLCTAATMVLFDKRLRHDQSHIAGSLMFFILLYYAGTTANSVASMVRYQIMVFPAALALAGMAAAQLIELIATKSRRDHVKGAAIAALAGLLIFSLAGTRFPISYASALLPRNHIVDVKDMGTGSYDAAQYLNTLPDAKNISIWTDKGGVCSFFVGTCHTFSDSASFLENHIDYFVVSSGRTARSLAIFKSKASNPYDFTGIYFSQHTLWQLDINDRPSGHVKIVEADDYRR